MRTVGEIMTDYKKSRENDSMVEFEHNCFRFKNEPLRDALREEYIQTLPEDKQFAIWLHKTLCNQNHTDMCCFYYEITDFVDNWGRSSHKRYLAMAQKIMSLTDDIELAKNIIKATKALYIDGV